MPAPRPEPRREATRDGGEPGQVALEHQRLHRPAPSCAGPPVGGPGRPGPPGWCGRAGPHPVGRADRAAAAGWLPPSALCHVSTCQPRRRAMAASLASGLTATGKPDRLEHGQVAGRVGVGHRLLEPEALGLGVVGQHQGPGLADGRQLLEPAGEPAVLDAQLGADDLVEQGPEAARPRSRGRR